MQEVREAAHHVQASAGQRGRRGGGGGSGVEEEDVARGGKPGPRAVTSGHQAPVWMSEHLGAIMHEVKQIVDDMKEVQDSRRVKVRPQAGVQMEEKEMAEAGVEC